MSGYIEAGYAVTLLTLAGYAASLRYREQRALRRRGVAEEEEQR